MSTTTSNLKQRFIRLLRKFKLPETETFESEEQYKGYMEQVMAQNETEIDDFLDEDDIGDFSDSGQEFDDISISSTPKPSLKPYFSTWTLEGPRDSTSLSNTFIEGADPVPTTSNSHSNSINTTLPLSSTSSSSNTPSSNITTGIPTTTITNHHLTSINNTSTSSSTSSSTLTTSPRLQKQNSEDKKSSKLRRILRKKERIERDKK